MVSSPVWKDEYGAALGVGISSPSKVWESSEVQPWMDVCTGSFPGMVGQVGEAMWLS